MDLSEDEFADWLQRSCEASGVGVKVSDDGAVQRVGLLLRGEP